MMGTPHRAARGLGHHPHTCPAGRLLNSLSPGVSHYFRTCLSFLSIPEVETLRHVSKMGGRAGGCDRSHRTREEERGEKGRRGEGRWGEERRGQLFPRIFKSGSRNIKADRVSLDIT